MLGMFALPSSSSLGLFEVSGPFGAMFRVQIEGMV